jgi:hypothetical protein
MEEKKSNESGTRQLPAQSSFSKKTFNLNQSRPGHPNEDAINIDISANSTKMGD